MTRSAALCNGHYWQQFLAGEFAGRTAVVLSAADGSPLWSKAIGYRSRPLIIGDTLYAEPWAFDLQTGDQKTRIHPLTGERASFEFERPGHHCGTVSGCPNLLLFRSGTTAYYDLVADHGTEHFTAQRPGCWINQIPANGLVVEPEASSGCVCNFAVRSTVVFKPRSVNKAWGVFASRGKQTPVRHAAVNLGAPGDRRDDDGTLWLSFPRPGGRLRLGLPAKAEIAKGGGYFSQLADRLVVGGTEVPWLFASGCEGLTKLTVPVDSGPAEYTVRLLFADLDNDAPGEREFDIKIQGLFAATNFDIIDEAGAPGRAIVKEVTGVAAAGEIVVEFVPSDAGLGRDAMPLLNALEVEIEG